jgi:hypothetical protein
MAVEDELAEVVENYVEQLRAMKRPAKEEINMLTMVAEQYMDRGPFALGLVQALERAIEEVTHKLFCEPRPSHIITWPFAIELSCASFMRCLGPTPSIPASPRALTSKCKAFFCCV